VPVFPQSVEACFGSIDALEESIDLFRQRNFGHARSCQSKPGV